MNRKTTFIYSLSDPNTGKVRYIGKTNNLKYRLWAHVTDATTDRRNSHKCNWIKLLLKENKRPIISVIEEVPMEIWQEREIYWINKFKENGENLVNMTDGGECGIISDNCREALKKCKRKPRVNFKHSEETKKIIREKRAKQIITEEHKKNISKGCKGKKRTDEQKKTLSMARKGMKFSKEHCINISKCRIKKIKEITTEGKEVIWDSADSISIFYGVSVSVIRKKVLNPNLKCKKITSKFYYL